VLAVEDELESRGEVARAGYCDQRHRIECAAGRGVVPSFHGANDSPRRAFPPYVIRRIVFFEWHSWQSAITSECWTSWAKPRPWMD
jgi:hypothetical protein